jgi:dihydroneopterin aldolase
VEGLRLDLFVGCLPEEKLQRQPVDIDFFLFFLDPPQGCISDHLEETICYAHCVEVIRKMVYKKHFHLIEHLGAQIHAALVNSVPKEVFIQVRVTKVHPPLHEIKKGVSFTYFSRGPHD